MSEAITANKMRKMAHEIKTQGVGKEVTLKIPLLTAGVLIRSSVRKFFVEVEIAGGEVTFKENKRWIESDFYNIRIVGSPVLLSHVALHMAEFFED